MLNRKQIRHLNEDQLRKEVSTLQKAVKDLTETHYKELETLKTNLGDVFINELMPLAEEILRQNHRLKEPSIEKFTTAYIQAVRNKLNNIANDKKE